MVTIPEIREQYPQYGDMSDEDLARGLHSKFYSDLDYADFSERIGLAPPEPTLASSFMRGAKTGLSTAQTAFESLTGDENEAAKAGIARSEEINRMYPSATSLDEITGIYNDPNKGLLPAAWETAKQAPYFAAEMAGPAAAMAAGALGATALAPAALTGAVGAGVVGGVGAGLPSFAMFGGANQERQAKAQIAEGLPVDVSRTKAFATAVPQTLLDVAGGRLMAGGALTSKLLGTTEERLAAMAADKLAKTAAQSITGSMARGVGAGIAGEVPTEVTQQALERAQAGLSVTDDDAIKEYKEAAFAAALGGGPLGSVGGIYNRQSARNQIEAQSFGGEEPPLPTPAGPKEEEKDKAPAPPQGPTDSLADYVKRKIYFDDGLHTIESVAPDVTTTISPTGEKIAHSTEGLAASLGIPAFSANPDKFQDGSARQIAEDEQENEIKAASPLSPAAAVTAPAAPPAVPLAAPAQEQIEPHKIYMPQAAALKSYLREKEKTAVRKTETKIARQAGMEGVEQKPARDAVTPKPLAKILTGMGGLKTGSDAATRVANLNIGYRGLVHPNGVFDDLSQIPLSELNEKLAPYGETATADAQGNVDANWLQKRLDEEQREKYMMTPLEREQEQKRKDNDEMYNALGAAGFEIDSKTKAADIAKAIHKLSTQDAAQNLGVETEGKDDKALREEMDAAANAEDDLGYIGDESTVADVDDDSDIPFQSRSALLPAEYTSDDNYDGYKTEYEKIQPTRRIAKIAKNATEGKSTTEQTQAEIQYLAEKMASIAEAKRFNKYTTARARGADFIREKLIRARRTGDLPEDAANFGLWALDKNPNIAHNLGVSVKKNPREGSAGEYNPAGKIIVLFKDSRQTGVVVHEILHHTERMMPEAVQQGIRKLWSKAFADAVKKATAAQKPVFDAMLEAISGSQTARETVNKAFRDGVMSYDKHYQLVNPSEFWAVNATDIMAKRYGNQSWIGQAKQWLSEMLQHVKSAIGMKSNSAVIKALNSIMQGDGEYVSKLMLAERKAKLKGNKGSAETIYNDAEKSTHEKLKDNLADLIKNRSDIPDKNDFIARAAQDKLTRRERNLPDDIVETADNVRDTAPKFNDIERAEKPKYWIEEVEHYSDPSKSEYKLHYGTEEDLRSGKSWIDTFAKKSDAKARMEKMQAEAGEQGKRIAILNGRKTTAKKVGGRWLVGGDVVSPGDSVSIAAKRWDTGEWMWHSLKGNRLTQEEVMTDAEIAENKNLITPTDRTDAGEQTVIPGAERKSQKEMLERGMEGPLKTKKEQKPANEGLFSDVFDENAAPEQLRFFSMESTSDAAKILATSRANKDINGFWALIGNPWQIAAESKIVNALYSVVKGRATYAEHLSHEYVNLQREYREMPWKSRKRIADYAREASGDMEILEKEKNGDFGGLNKEEIAALKAMRKSFEQVGPNFVRAYADNAGIKNTKDKKISAIQKELEAIIEKDDVSTAEKTAAKRALNASRVLRFVVPNYWPRIRTGDYWINIVDAEGLTVFNDQLYSNTLGNRLMRPLSSTPGKNVEDALVDLVKQYPPSAGYKISHDYVAKSKNPSSMGLDSNTIDQLMSAGMKADGDMDAFFTAMDYVVEKLAEVQKPSFMQQSKKIKGFPDQPHDDIIDTYTNMVSHIPARLAYEERWTKSVNGIGNGRPNERKYAEAYKNYINQQNSAGLSAVRLWTFYSAFALRPLTPIANWGSTHTVAAPLMGQYFGTVRSHSMLSRVFNTAIKGIEWSKEDGLIFNPEKLQVSPELRKAIKNSPNLSNYNARDMQGKEVMETLKGRMTEKAATAWERTAKWLSSGMGSSEQFARHQSFIAAYTGFAKDAKARAAFMKKHGADHRYITAAEDGAGIGSPESMADWVVQSAFFDAGKMNHSPWERGWLGVPTQFKGYGYKLLSTMIGLAANGGPQGKLTAAILLGSALTMSGMAGAPEVDDIEKLWKLVDPNTNFKTTWRRMLQNDLGFTQYGADVIINGAGNAVGVPIGRQFSMSSLLPNNADLAALLGPAAGLTFGRIQSGNRRKNEGQPLGANADYLGAIPGIGTTARNIALATTVYPEEGVRTSYGKTIIPAGEVTAAERAKAALGIGSPRINQEYELNQEMAMEGKKGEAERDRTTAALADLSVKRDNANERGDRAAALGYQKEYAGILSDYSKKMNDPKLPLDEKYPITATTVRNKVMAMKDPRASTLKNLNKYQRPAGAKSQQLYEKPY